MGSMSISLKKVSEFLNSNTIGTLRTYFSPIIGRIFKQFFNFLKYLVNNLAVEYEIFNKCANH